MKIRLIFILLSLVALSNSSWSLDLVGDITKHHREHFIDLNLFLGKEETHYTLKGMAHYHPGFFQSDLFFDALSVQKHSLSLDGGSVSLTNEGFLHLYPRVREVSELTLVGIPLKGSYTEGWLDRGTWFSNLFVSGVPSKGCLDYNPWNGHYNVKDQCSFGRSLIESSQKNSSCALNYDYFWTDNVLYLSMYFGDLLLNGTVRYSDTYETKRNHEGKGRISLSRVVDTSRATFDATLTFSNQREIDLSNESQDLMVREFLAFLELMSWDVFLE